MPPRHPVPLALAVLVLGGCAAAPPEDRFDCRVIPTGMVECVPLPPAGPQGAAAR